MDRNRLTTKTSLARLGAEICILLGVLLTAWTLIALAALYTPYHVDETHYLRSSRYFSHAIINRDFAHPDWADGYVTHTQPMLARYLIGVSLWLQGVDPETIPLTDDYQYHRTFEENLALGTIPSVELLHMGRTPMIGFGLGVVGLVYVLARLVTGPAGGLAAAIFALGSPLTMQLLVRAAPDAMMMFFLLLVLTLSVVGARRRDGGINVRWALLLGTALGLAVGSKLTSILGIAATIGWSGIVALLAFGLSRERSFPARVAFAWRAAGGWLLAVVIAYPVFVLTNPHLYPSPLEHTAHLLTMPMAEDEVVRQEFPQFVLSPNERPGYVVRGSLMDHTLTGRVGYPIEPLLAAIGGAALSLQVWRLWRRERQIRARGLILMTVLTYYLGISTAISLTWDRYLLPTVVLSALLSGIGVAWIGRGLGLALRYLRALIAQCLPRFQGRRAASVENAL